MFLLYITKELCYKLLKTAVCCLLSSIVTYLLHYTVNKKMLTIAIHNDANCSSKVTMPYEQMYSWLYIQKQTCDQMSANCSIYLPRLSTCAACVQMMIPVISGIVYEISMNVELLAVALAIVIVFHGVATLPLFKSAVLKTAFDPLKYLHMYFFSLKLYINYTCYKLKLHTTHQ